MKTVYLVHITTGTRDWERYEEHVTTDLTEVQKMESVGYKETLLLGDVDYADVETIILTDKEQLYECLSIEQLFEVYPDTQKLLDRFFTEENESI